MFLQGHAKDLILSLLAKNPRARLGARDVIAATHAEAVAASYSELKSHPFFIGKVKRLETRGDRNIG